jgi:TfdA family taurine catabolism dioxygenase TauD
VLRSLTPPSRAELRRYCLALGGILEFDEAAEIRTVRYEPTIRNSTALSLDALPLHSDGTFLERPPARFMLSFTTADPDGGGVSTFMPISYILAAAPDWVIEALLVARFLFPRGYDGDTDVYVGPVLYHERSSLRIRWRSDHLWRPKVVDAMGVDAQGAVDWLHKYLSTAEALTYAARTGETLLVPNTVLLHGRTRLSPNSPREVLRAWVVTA